MELHTKHKIFGFSLLDGKIIVGNLIGSVKEELIIENPAIIELDPTHEGTEFKAKKLTIFANQDRIFLKEYVYQFIPKPALVDLYLMAFYDINPSQEEGNTK